MSAHLRIPLGLRLAAGLLFCAMSLPLAFAQTMYKSITPDGRIVYSDRPPAEARVLKTMVPVRTRSSALPDSAAEEVQKARKSGSAGAAPAGVVLFSASWCKYCAAAKAYLAEKGIAYQDYDVDTPAGLDAYAIAGGRKAIPLLVSGNRHIEGFSTAGYDRFFATR